MEIIADPVIENILTFEFCDKDNQCFFDCAYRLPVAEQNDRAFGDTFRAPNKLLLREGIHAKNFIVHRKWIYIGNKRTLSIRQPSLGFPETTREGHQADFRTPTPARPFYRIMTDYGAHAWDYEGASTSIQFDFPEVQSLEDQFLTSWDAGFKEFNDFKDNFRDWSEPDKWKLFHANSIEFCIHTKQMLGNKIDLIYQTPYEDASSDFPEVHIIG